MSTQVLFGIGDSFSTVGNNFISGNLNGSSQFDPEPMVVGGSFSRWYLELTAAPGGGATRTFTIVKNGTPTAAVITFGATDTVGSYVGAPISFAATDTIFMDYAETGAPAAAVLRSAILWTPDTDETYLYGWGDGTNLNNNQQHPIVGGGGMGTTHAFTSTIATPGTITAHRVKLRTAPGAGTSRIFTLIKNGVTQDGSGGTVDTRVTISDANTAATASFTLPVAAGDTLAVTATISGAPAATNWWGGTFAFTPITVGEYFTVQSSASAAADGTSTFDYPARGRSAAWSATLVQALGHPEGYLLNRFAIEIAAAPGAGKSWTYALQKNGVDTALTLTISGTETRGVMTIDPPIEITGTDHWNLRAQASGSPAAGTSPVRVGGNGKGKGKPPSAVLSPASWAGQTVVAGSAPAFRAVASGGASGTGS